MNIKLDENLGNLRVVTRLRLAGYDVTTVREQGLTSAPDEELINEGDRISKSFADNVLPNLIQQLAGAITKGGNFFIGNARSTL